MNSPFLDYLLSNVSENKKAIFEGLVKYRTRKATVVLEDFYQPHNAGAVMRSCDCFGIQDVHIIENRNKWEMRPEVERGSSKWLSLNRYNELPNNTSHCLTDLINKGYKLVATTPYTDLGISELPLREPVAFIFGTEKKGVSPLAMEMAHYKVKIPMFGFTDSFNVSVAAAICLHSFRQRLENEIPDWQLTDAEREEVLLYWCKKALHHFKDYEKHFFGG